MIDMKTLHFPKKSIKINLLFPQVSISKHKLFFIRNLILANYCEKTWRFLYNIFLLKQIISEFFFQFSVNLLLF